MLSKRDKNMSISDTIFVKKTIREAFPAGRYGSAFAAQCEAYAFLIKEKLEKKITMRRVRTMWEGAARRIDGEEKDALRRAKIEEARREQKEIRKRLSNLDEEIALLDSELASAPRS